MDFSLTILGTSAAVPAYGRFCSGQLFSTPRASFLIDCGEGTQMQLQKTGLGQNDIGVILISHLHGDHYFGLFGLLTSWALAKRSASLLIVSPPGLQQRVEAVLELEKYPLPFVIRFETHEPKSLLPIWSSKYVDVFTFPLAHRIPTNGYLIREKQALPNMRAEAIQAYEIPYQAIPAIKAGGDFVGPDGLCIPHADLVFPPMPPRSYAHCSDTRYLPALATWLQGVDLLYHEATFLHEDLEQAIKTAHTTALEAAHLAVAAQVGTLVMGHFSARYPNITALEQEARRVFPKAYAAKELMRFVIPHTSRLVGAAT